jgi:hypothetical protein
MIEDHNFRTGGTLPVAIHLRPAPGDPKCWCRISSAAPLARPIPSMFWRRMRRNGSRSKARLNGPPRAAH